MNLILLGAPGAGKGTQAEVICDHLQIPAISTGNILREAVKNGSELGLKAKSFMDSGALVPDEVVINILKERIAQDDCKKGFILDGFPRTVPQAEALDAMGVQIDCVLSLEVADEAIMQRLSGRRVCQDCGASYHIDYKPSKVEGVCDRCGGKGKIIKTPCTSCRGLGRVRRTTKVSVNVPAGIDDGQTFVMRGQGDHGVNGGPAGDLNVTVSVRPDPIFERDGYDVWCDVPVTFAQAVLGDELTVPTIDGKVKYSIPEGTQPGTTFRLRNKGINYVNGRGRGDQYVRVLVEVPKNLNAKQKDALREFDKLASDRNYEKRKSFFDKLKDLKNMNRDNS